MSDILVVGAGPVGMVAAAFLRRAGVKCDIVDPKSGPVTESRALGIHARTLEFLSSLGLAEKFIRAGRATRYMRFHRPGRELFSLDFDVLRDITEFPFYLILPQARTETFLNEYLTEHGGQPEWGVQLVNLNQDADGVQVTLRDAAGRDSVRRYQYVLGADGAGSVVRSLLNVNFAGATYQARFLLAEVELGEARIDTDSTHVFIGDNTTVAVIPQPGKQFRIVGPDFTQGETAAEAIDFSRFERFLADNQLFKGWRFHSPSRVMSYRMHKRVAEQFRVGRVFLAGDAAHIHSPAGGQGMNTGMHDAVNLSWKLALVLKGQAGPGLLDSYEHERRSTANGVVAATDKAMQMVTRPKPFMRFLMGAVGPMLFRIYQPKATIAAMAQLKLHYRGSLDGQGKTAVLEVGDRMPRLPVARLQTTLDAFRDGGFVLFLCGDATAIDKHSALLHELHARLPLTCWAIVSDRNFHAREPDLARYFPDSSGVYARLGAPAAILCRPDGYVLAIDSADGLPNVQAAVTALSGMGRAGTSSHVEPRHDARCAA